jgi:outer membrane protein
MNRTMKRVLAVAAILMVAGFWASSALAAPEKVGYINLQRLVNESEMGKEAKEDLVKLRQQREAVVAKKLKEINALKEDLNNRGGSMDAAVRQDKLGLLQKAYKEYQRMVADAKEDITREDRLLVNTILQKADPVLKKIAKKKKFAIILKDPNAIGYLDPSADITEDVLKALNK